MDILWRDRKRVLGMPVTFTKYALTTRLVTQQRGLFTTVHDEVQLFRVTDVKVVRTLGDKLFGVGTVILYSSDQSHPQFHIHQVRDPLGVKAMVMERVGEERRRNRVIANDMLMNAGDMGEDCLDFACDSDGQALSE